MREALEFARLDMNSICTLQALVSLNQLVSEAIADLQNGKGRKIVIEGEELNISILADSEPLKQVLLRLVERMGGILNVYSQLGEGSIFEIIL